MTFDPEPPADPMFLADCRARLAFELLANTWNGVVLWALRKGPVRHSALRDRIGGISQKVLTETLRRLEFNGLVVRRAYGGSPPRVEYELTALGRTLLAPIDALGAWAYDHADEVMAAQDRAEETHPEPGVVIPSSAAAPSPGRPGSSG